MISKKNTNEGCWCFPYLRYFLKGRNKVVIADDGQSIEHVDSLEHVVQTTLVQPVLFGNSLVIHVFIYNTRWLVGLA